MKDKTLLTKRQNKLIRRLIKAKDRGDITVTDKVIASMFGCAPSKISNIRTDRNLNITGKSEPIKGKREPISEKVAAKISKLALEGKSILEIRHATKVSYSTARRYRQRAIESA